MLPQSVVSISAVHAPSPMSWQSSDSIHSVLEAMSLYIMADPGTITRRSGSDSKRGYFNDIGMRMRKTIKRRNAANPIKPNKSLSKISITMQRYKIDV